MSKLSGIGNANRNTTNKKNWFDYLAHQTTGEPVGFRHIARLVTTLYFELVMIVAAPIALLGAAVLTWHYRNSYWIFVAYVAGAIIVAVVFYRQAKVTHETLCRTRKEINTRLRAN